MTEMSPGQLEQTVEMLNLRLKVLEVPTTPEKWLQLILEVKELTFLLTFGGGYIFKIITEGEDNIEGKSAADASVTDQEDAEYNKNSEVLEVFLNLPNRPT